MGETKARCEGDVRKLAHFFETLGTSSPEKIINRKGSAGSGTSKFRGPVAGGGGAYVDKRPCVPCSQCSKSHPPYSVCPFTEVSCRICDKAHYTDSCPYLRHLPRGAKLNPGYEIVCSCGNEFNEDRWACTFCGGGRPVPTGKCCFICHVSYDHNVYECPEDPVLAAEYKLVRDKILLRVPGHDDLFYTDSS